MSEIIVLTGLVVILGNSIMDIGKAVMEDSRRKQIKCSDARHKDRILL